MHYLCFVWAAALMWHAPQRIFWFIGVPVTIYITDKLTEILFKTHLIESAYFERLGMTSCIVSFENPPGFGKQNSAYVYIMLPWLSKYQFHAFTVFPCTKPNHSSVCIHKCGDWTTMLMEKISTPTHKPAFVIGPYLSPFSSPAMNSCGGIWYRCHTSYFFDKAILENSPPVEPYLDLSRSWIN